MNGAVLTSGKPKDLADEPSAPDTPPTDDVTMTTDDVTMTTDDVTMTTDDRYTVTMTFVSAGVSNMVAGTVTNFIDVVKVRMQCDSQRAGIYERQYPGLARGAAKIYRTEGAVTLFTAGLFPAIIRELSYSTIRMGGYEPLKRLISPGCEELPLPKKMVAGGLAGGFGALLTTPIDLAKVQIQTDLQKKLPNTFLLLYRLALSEGVASLWRGVGPNIARGVTTTAAQMPSYDHTKHYLLKQGWLQEGPALHLLCSVVAGFCMATANNPADVAKSRIQSERRVSGARPTYRNIVQVVWLVARREGVLGLYKGWFPNWVRVAPHSCITLMLFEQLRILAGIKPI